MKEAAEVYWVHNVFKKMCLFFYQKYQLLKVNGDVYHVEIKEEYCYSLISYYPDCYDLSCQNW